MARRFKTKAWNVGSVLDLLNEHKSARHVARLLDVSEYTVWLYMRTHHIVRENCYTVDAAPVPATSKVRRE